MSSIFSRIKVVGVATIGLAVSACATSLTSTIDTADNVDLGDFKTYAWVSDKPMTDYSVEAPELINPVNHVRIRAEIDNALQNKGYVKVPFANADLAVSYSVGARDRIKVQNYYNDFGYNYYGYYNGFSRFGRGFSRFGSGFGGYSTPTVRTITEGTVVVDIFDNMRKEAIWHGTASKRLSGSSSGQQLVSEAVATLLSEFPQSTKMADVMDKMDRKPTST